MSVSVGTCTYVCVQNVICVCMRMCLYMYKSRVPDQNSVSQAQYIVEIYHSGRKPSKYKACKGI